MISVVHSGHGFFRIEYCYIPVLSLIELSCPIWIRALICTDNSTINPEKRRNYLDFFNLFQVFGVEFFSSSSEIVIDFNVNNPYIS